MMLSTSRSKIWSIIITLFCFIFLLFPNIFGTKDINALETCVYALLFWGAIYALSHRLFVATAYLASLWWVMSLFLTWQSSVKINPTFLGMVLNTNLAEIYDFFSTFGWWWLIAFFVWQGLITVMLIFVYRHPLKIETKHRVLIVSLSVLLYAITLFFMTDEDVQPLNSPPSDVNSAFTNNFDFNQNALLTNKLQNIYPFDLPISAWSFHTNWQGTMKTFNALPPMNAYALDDNMPDTVMLVIGESARRDHWGLYGYTRNTTPLITKHQEKLLRFDDMISQTVATRTALSIMLSRYPILRTDNKNTNQVEHSIVSAFNQAGYQTYWLSNQGQSSFFDNPIALLANDAQHTHFTNSNDHTTTGRYDEALLPYVEKALTASAGKKMLVVHLMGSHFNYGHRYPEQFAQFKPHLANKWIEKEDAQKNTQKLINSYDNSILYTDYILDRLLTSLQTTEKEKSVLFLYISDHAEDLEGEILTNETGSCEIKKASRLSYRAYQIPFIMWASPAYIAAHPDHFQKMVQAQSLPLQQDFIPQTVLDLAGIDIQGNAKTSSILDLDNIKHTIERQVLTATGLRHYETAKKQSPCNLSQKTQ